MRTRLDALAKMGSNVSLIEGGLAQTLKSLQERFKSTKIRPDFYYTNIFILKKKNQPLKQTSVFAITKEFSLKIILS